MLSKIITKASFLVTPDDPKPGTSASTASSSRAQAAEDTSKRLDQVREICPDLVEEIKEEWDKKEVCKMCGDKVNFYLLSKVQKFKTRLGHINKSTPLLAQIQKKN